MTILLIAEHDNASVKDATAKALSAALAMGGDIHILVAGQNASGAAAQAAQYAGVAKVLVAESAALANGLAEPVAALIVSLAGGYDAIVAPSTTSGRNILPRVAALLDVMQVSDITKVVSADTFERPIYAGNAIQTVRSKDAKKVVTVRTAAFPAAATGGSAAIESVPAAADPSLSTYIGEELSKSDRPELTSAKIIVSGGRAMQSRENFTTYIEPVADKLGAAMGASRPRALCRGRHFRRAPASGRHEGLQGHRRNQQGRGGADLPGGRLRPGRRPLHRPAGTGHRTDQDRPLTRQTGKDHGRSPQAPGVPGCFQPLAPAIEQTCNSFYAGKKLRQTSLNPRRGHLVHVTME